MCAKSKYSVEDDAKQMSKQVSNVSSASNVVILQDYTLPAFKRLYVSKNKTKEEVSRNVSRIQALGVSKPCGKKLPAGKCEMKIYLIQADPP